MPREREGHLIRKADGTYKARVTAERPDGTRHRPWVHFDTTDPKLAQRLLDREVGKIDAGFRPKSGATVGGKSVRDFFESVKADMSEADQTFLASHLGPIAALPVAAVTEDHVQRLVSTATSKKLFAGGKTREGIPLATESKKKLLGAVSRLLAKARRKKLISTDPTADVELPKLRGADREVKKRRVILTEEELSALLSCPEFLPEDVRPPYVTEERARDFFGPQRLEMKLMSLVSRTEGGMRTGDVLAWDWEMIDVRTFETCLVPREKTAEMQRLDVPEVLRDPLRLWWEHEGKPTKGPVFPVRIGPRAGEQRLATSYAKRPRHDLARALKWAGIDARPELFADTKFTRRVDFHSFRRAFATGLARAGVNAQQAMVLANHRSASTHLGYVQLAQEQATIPEAALPKLRLVVGGGASKSSEEVRDDSESSGKSLDRDFSSAPGWARTSDQPLRRRLLYPLSYERTSRDGSRHAALPRP
jgi:integrase